MTISKNEKLQTENKLYKKYQSIWHCKNPSKKLDRISSIVTDQLKSHKYEIDINGNIFIGNFEKNRPCLVAHLDSVFDGKPKKISLNKGILTSKNGLGGDDKCGIIAILEILKTNDNINAIFTVDEEIGGIGASKIQYSQIANVNYFIEIDRQGKSDIINNIYGSKITDEDFINDISSLILKYGFKLANGAYTDVYDLCSIGGISSINLSSGYYNPHTKNEYVILEELQNTINFVKEILKTTQKKYTITFVDDMDDIDIPIAVKDTVDLQELIDLSQFCDYKDMEIMLLKAYQLGELKNKEDMLLTNMENSIYFD